MSKASLNHGIEYVREHRWLVPENTFKTPKEMELWLYWWPKARDFTYGDRRSGGVNVSIPLIWVLETIRAELYE